jgi:hypothetical protein
MERSGALARYLAGQLWRRNRNTRFAEPEEIQMSGAEDFDAVIGTYHEALRAIISGDPSGYKALYSQAEDVTLANPFGGVARGRTEIEQRLDSAAANFRDGEVVGFETITRVGDTGACVPPGGGEVQGQGRWRRRADPD